MARITTITFSFDDGSIQTYTPPLSGNINPVTPPPPPPPSGIIKGGYFDGIPDAQAKTIAAPFGMTWVRVWFAIRDWNTPPVAADFARARMFKAQGFKVLAVFTPLEKTATSPAGSPPDNYDQGYNWFSNAAKAADGAVDAWEVWNEPNLSQYNANAGFSGWVQTALIPAYAALKSWGQFVVSGGWSGTAGSPFQYAIDKGLLGACDAVGYHPYGTSVADQVAKVQDMRNRIGSKPLWLTEWNLHMNAKDALTWGTGLAEAARSIKPYVQAVFHFRLYYNTSQAGVAAPYGTTLGQLAKRVPWYDNTVAAMGAL
jgi:hypothetical protein